jgi:hypothetical protein
MKRYDKVAFIQLCCECGGEKQAHSILENDFSEMVLVMFRHSRNNFEYLRDSTWLIATFDEHAWSVFLLFDTWHL